MSFIGPLTEKDRIFSNEEWTDLLELVTDQEIFEFYTKQRIKCNIQQQDDIKKKIEDRISALQ